MSSWAGVTSTPTGRAPCLTSQAEKYAVPHPSSITSSPSTSPMTPSSRSGCANTPQVNSSSAQDRAADGPVNSAFACVQTSRFRET